MPRKLSVEAQAVRRESGKEIPPLWSELRSRVIKTSPLEFVISGLQLGKRFDTFPDTSLKRILQRDTDAGNADDGTARLQGVGKARIEFGSEANQTGRVGRGQLEYAHKPRRRFEQGRPGVRLRTGFGP